MIARRIWFSSFSPCHSPASRLATRQLDSRFFSTATRANYSHYFTRTLPVAYATSGTAQKLFSRSSLLQSTLFFRRTNTVNSRVGWYRDRDPNPIRSTSRRSSGSSGGRRPSFDFQPKGPYDRFRLWFDQFHSNYIVYGILALNGAVFIAWQVAKSQLQQGDTSLFMTLSENVLNSWRNIREGRIWSILGSAFSHSDSAHILLNGFSFYFLAPPIVNLIGNTSFMILYLFGGIACSTTSLLLNQSVRKRDGSSHGASGAIFAVMSFFACVSPNTTFLIFGVLPAPAWAVVTGFFIWDGFSTLVDRASVIDGAGHVGGIIAGVVYYIAKRRLFF